MFERGAPVRRGSSRSSAALNAALERGAARGFERGAERGEAGEARALVAAARRRAAALADAGGEPRRWASEADGSLAELRAVNAAESRALGDAFVSTHFLDTMVARAKARGPKGAREAQFFGALRATHGVWSLVV